MRRGQLQALLFGSILGSAGWALLLVALGIFFSSILLRYVLMSALQLSLIAIGIYIAWRFIQNHFNAKSIDWGDVVLTFAFVFAFIGSGLVAPLVARLFGLPFQVVG